jgi:cytidine deaminase
VLAEFGDEDVVIWCASEEGADVQEYGFSKLLPHAFSLPQRVSSEDELILGGM